MKNKLAGLIKFLPILSLILSTCATQSPTSTQTLSGTFQTTESKNNYSSNLDKNTQAQALSDRLQNTEDVKVGEIQYLLSETEPNPQLEQAILQTLPNYEELATPEDSIRYYYNFVDLNGDEQPEVVVYLVGRYVCGSGGCNILIFTQDGQDYQLMTEMTISPSPILVTSQRTNGWSDIVFPYSQIVRQGDDYYQRLYYTRMQFDGQTYPSNPSVQPEVEPNTTLNGVAVIADEISVDSGILLRPHPQSQFTRSSKVAINDNELYVDDRCIPNPNLAPIDRFVVVYASEFFAQGKTYWLSAANYQDGATILCISEPEFAQSKPLNASEINYQFIDNIVKAQNSNTTFIVTITEGQNYPISMTEYRLDLSNPEKPRVTRLGIR